MEIPHHITLHASFIVRISAEYLIEGPTATPANSANSAILAGPLSLPGKWAIHGWMVLANSGESWRFSQLRDLPDILARWIDDNRDKQPVK